MWVYFCEQRHKGKCNFIAVFVKIMDDSSSQKDSSSFYDNSDCKYHFLLHFPWKTKLIKPWASSDVLPYEIMVIYDAAAHIRIALATWSSTANNTIQFSIHCYGPTIVSVATSPFLLNIWKQSISGELLRAPSHCSWWSEFTASKLSPIGHSHKILSHLSAEHFANQFTEFEWCFQSNQTYVVG